MIYLLKYMLDTNACINYLNFSNSLIWQKIQSSLSFEIAVCSVVKDEMFYGSMKNQNPQKSLREQNEFSRIGNLKIEDWEI